MPGMVNLSEIAILNKLCSFLLGDFCFVLVAS